MERINVRVDHELKRDLEAEAREKGISPSDIVRQALREHLNRREPGSPASTSLAGSASWGSTRTPRRTSAPIPRTWKASEGLIGESSSTPARWSPSWPRGTAITASRQTLGTLSPPLFTCWPVSPRPPGSSGSSTARWIASQRLTPPGSSRSCALEAGATSPKSPHHATLREHRPSDGRRRLGPSRRAREHPHHLRPRPARFLDHPPQGNCAPS